MMNDTENAGGEGTEQTNTGTVVNGDGDVKINEPGDDKVAEGDQTGNDDAGEKGDEGSETAGEGAGDDE